MKPKLNSKNPLRDECQTPPLAVFALLDILQGTRLKVWEPCGADGYLSAAIRCLLGLEVIETKNDYFSNNIPEGDIQITNPPFSKKYKWLKKAYEFRKPFALLMPVDVVAAQSAQKLFQQYGIQIILLDKRINFNMPNKGWSGQANFSVEWFTFGLGLKETFTYYEMPHAKYLPKWLVAPESPVEVYENYCC